MNKQVAAFTAIPQIDVSDLMARGASESLGTVQRIAVLPVPAARWTALHRISKATR